MLYISPDNEYPRYAGDIQRDNPTWKIGDALPEGWVRVEESVRPIPAEGYLVYEDTPAEVDGVMTQQWATRVLTAEEEARISAPTTVKAKLIALGLTEDEVYALANGLVR